MEWLAWVVLVKAGLAILHSLFGGIGVGRRPIGPLRIGRLQF